MDEKERDKNIAEYKGSFKRTFGVLCDIARQLTRIADALEDIYESTKSHQHITGVR